MKDSGIIVGMRILQSGKFYPVRGGVEKVMWDITEGLSGSGIECDMLCADADDTVPSGQGSTVIGMNGGGRCIVVPSMFKMAATMISPAMVRWMRIHAREYDIVHVHHPDPMACLALVTSGFKGKVVLHWHSDILKQKLLLKFYRPLQSWLLKRADRIVCTSPVYAAESPGLKGFQDKVTVIPIGISPVTRDEEGAARIRERFAGKKIVYSLGRLVEYKGYEYLIEAASYLDDGYVVVIGGEGPLREELQRRIDEAGLGEKVKLVGRVDDPDFAAWYCACDVFCLSSIWKTEAFAIVQVEAMSCGKPVVATRIPGSGVSWVNEDNVSGINVEPEDGKALAEAIKKVCGDGYDAFSKGAGMRYDSMFTLDGMIEKCKELYETI